MKRCFILLAVFVCLYSGNVRAASFTMEQAVSRALDVNPTIQSKLLVLEQARMNVGVAQSYFWPRVSIVASYNELQNRSEIQTYSSDDLSSKSWSQGWRLTLSLFAGFAHLNNVQKSLLQVDVEKARHRQARLELITNVQLQFLALLQAREDLATAEESVKRIRKQLEASEAFVRVDMAPYANVLQNRVELSRAQQEVIRCKNDIRNAEVQLNRYLGFSPHERITYAGRLQDFHGVVSYTEEQAIKTALYSRPDLIVAQKSVAVAYKDTHIAMGNSPPEWMPATRIPASAKIMTTGGIMTIPAATGPSASTFPGISSVAAAPCSTLWPSGTGPGPCKKTMRTPWPAPGRTSSRPCSTWTLPGSSSLPHATVLIPPGKIMPCPKSAI